MVLEPEGDLVVDLEHRQLRLGVLEEHANGARQLGEPGLTGIAAPDEEPAAVPVRVERVRDHAVEAQRERALAASRRTEEQEALALAPLQGQLAQRRRAPPDVTDGQRVGTREVH